jgi:L-threonylcarbamoyladenylate synthase
LRPGKISAIEIANITGLAISAVAGKSRAPGMLLAHYAPQARVELCHSYAEAQERQKQYAEDGVLAEILHNEDSVTYALSLYDNLRAADMNNCRVVLAVLPPDEGLGTAIRDRLTKAAASN